MSDLGADEHFRNVSLVGGSWDGTDTQVPDAAGFGQIIELPDRATELSAPDEPTSGPVFLVSSTTEIQPPIPGDPGSPMQYQVVKMERYRLEFEGERLVGRLVND